MYKCSTEILVFVPSVRGNGLPVYIGTINKLHLNLTRFILLIPIFVWHRIKSRRRIWLGRMRETSEKTWTKGKWTHTAICLYGTQRIVGKLFKTRRSLGCFLVFEHIPCWFI